MTNHRTVLCLLAGLYFPALACCAIDYRPTIMDWEANLSALPEYNSGLQGLLADRGQARRVCSLAALKMVLYDWTGEIEYADAAKDLLQATMDYTTSPESSFFVPYVFVYAYDKLDRAGLLDGAFKARAVEFAEAYFKPAVFYEHPVEIHNRHLCLAAGLAYAARVWPSSPRAAGWHQFAVDYWNFFLTLEDIPENAPNYDQICFQYIWFLGDQLEQTSRLNTPSIHNMFLRAAAQIAPSGKTAEYGDSGEAVAAADWPITETLNWGFRAAALQRAATFFNDPALKWAAEKVWLANSVKEPIRGRYIGSQPLFHLTFADLWQNSDLAAAMPDFGSAVLTRRYQKTVPGPVYDFEDKLILSPSRSDGAPFLLMDLFSPHGSHAHINQQGAVNHYEFNNVPLLTGLGYNARNPEHSNLFLIKPADRMFPHDNPLYNANRWYTTEIPLTNIHWGGAEGFRKFDQITFRISSQNSSGVALRVDNLRLCGPAGEILLDRFESLSGWSIPADCTATLISYDKTEGGHSMQILVPESGVYWARRNFGKTTVNLSEYDHFKIDWKLSNTDDPARPFIFRVESVDETVVTDYHCHSLQLAPVKTKVLIDGRTDWHYGSIRFDRYFSRNTQLTRRMLMDSQTGIVLIRDDLLPDGDADGRQAGPVWNLCSTANPQVGTNWIDTSGGSEELLIYMSEAPGRQIGLQTLNVPTGRNNQRVAFSRETIRAAVPTRFVSLLVPHAPLADASGLASGIHIIETGDGYVGQTRAAINHAAVGNRRLMIDVLGEDDDFSAVVCGDWEGELAVHAYDGQNLADRVAGALTFRAFSANIRYSVQGESLTVSSLGIEEGSFLEHHSRLLFDSSRPVSARISYEGEIATGRIEGQIGDAIAFYTPTELFEIDLGGLSLIGSYDAVRQVYSGVLSAGETCQSIHERGLLLAGDISGPAGIPDCHVDIYDLSVLAEEWLRSVFDAD